MINTRNPGLLAPGVLKSDKRTEKRRLELTTERVRDLLALNADFGFTYSSSAVAGFDP
jgi:hypothetical protein